MRHPFFTSFARTVQLPFPALACIAWAWIATVAPGAPPPPPASIFLEEEGFSTLGTHLRVSATLTTQWTDNMVADTIPVNPLDPSASQHYLKVVLRSFGAPTKGRADVLSSFYFNLADPTAPNLRPTDLTLTKGSGLAYQLHAPTKPHDPALPVTPYSWNVGTKTWAPNSSTPSTLVATKAGDEGWQFKSQNPVPEKHPSLGFGIGTVGNSKIQDFIPTGFSFDGPVVRGNTPGDMINLGIYSDGTNGSGTPAAMSPDGGLDGWKLIRTEATFMFRTDGFDLRAVKDRSWVQDNVIWGFGTNPETVFLPEPGTLPMLASAGLFASGWLARRTMRSGRPLRDGEPCSDAG